MQCHALHCMHACHDMQWRHRAHTPQATLQLGRETAVCTYKGDRKQSDCRRTGSWLGVKACPETLDRKRGRWGETKHADADDATTRAPPVPCQSVESVPPRCANSHDCHTVPAAASSNTDNPPYSASSTARLPAHSTTPASLHTLYWPPPVQPFISP